MDSPRQIRPIWQYYEELDGGLKATCLLCGRVISRGGKTRSTCNTSNQKNHLRLTHPNEFKAVTSEILKRKAATPAKPATLRGPYRTYKKMQCHASANGSMNSNAHFSGTPQQALDPAEYPGPSTGSWPEPQPKPFEGEATSGTYHCTEPWSSQELLTNALNAVLNGASDVLNGLSTPSTGGATHADELAAHPGAMKQEPMDETDIAKRTFNDEQPQVHQEQEPTTPDVRNGPEPFSGQEMLNHALRAVLNGANGRSASSMDEILNVPRRAGDATVQRKKQADDSGTNRTLHNLNGLPTATSSDADLRNMTMEELKAEVLRSEIRRNLSEERRNVAMTKFFDRLAERF